MSKNKFILAGLLLGAVAMGTACKSTSAAERNEPMEPTTAPAHQATPPAANPNPTPGTGGAGMDDSSGIVTPYTVPQEDRAGTGGSGYDDAVTNPNASDTSNSKLKARPDIRDQDPVVDPGTGGSGYEKDGTLFRQDNTLSGDKFPGDHNVPQ